MLLSVDWSAPALYWLTITANLLMSLAIEKSAGSACPRAPLGATSMVGAVLMVCGIGLIALKS